MSKYTRDYFIAKFEAIPDEKWCIRRLHDEHGRSCALGHCCSDVGGATEEAGAFSDLFEWGAGSVNDGQDARYTQSTPKARILAALRDLPATNKL